MSEEAQILNEDVVENPQDDELIPFQYSITSYGADYPVDGLVKRLKSDSIYIPPFQRGYVWGFREASRFIESLLLGLPVPGIFMAKEKDTQKLLVIDGQQRLRTLQYFYEGIFPPADKPFALIQVQEQFKGATYKSLEPEDRLRLDDAILHATIIRQDEPSNDESSIYYIFERLNTSGLVLKPQEIRSCIYHGDFNQMLHLLNENRLWRDIFGSLDKHMRDQELILRFFALYSNYENYKLPMKGFLNEYMAKNKNLDARLKQDLQNIFEETIKVIHEAIGKRAFKPIRGMNASIFDAVMVGIGRRIQKGKIQNLESLKEKYNNLLQDKEFLNVSIDAANTSHEKNVKKRIKLAIEIFTDVE